MGWWDSVLGRSKPAQPDLDQLFGIPGTAVTLATAADLTPTGVGAVCFRAAEGGAFAQVSADVQALLDADQGPPVERVDDSYGYTWLVVRRDPDDVAGLVTDLHAVNSTLVDNGFGPALLCSLVAFGDSRGRRVGLVYLFKRGTFYPFAPQGEPRRDSALELQVRGLLGDDLKVEQDLSRWFPVWGAPGL
ncbi:MAG: PspA-associated protein PspAB [Actinomycetes bacterium]